MQETATTTVTMKNLGYVAAFLAGLELRSFLILAVFMAVDLALGTIRSGVVHGWSSVKSYKFIAGITSKLLVLIVPLVVVWAGRGAGVDLLFLAKGALAMLVLGEAYSILGNINSIRLGQDIVEFDVISSILCTVQKVIERLLAANRDKI
jgi:phage-related holin